MESIHPLCYFWIAFYGNNECLPQFDFESGNENPFSAIEQSKKFGLFPFARDFALKVNTAAGKTIVEVKGNLPHFILKLNKNQRLIYARRNYIDNYIYQHCRKCNYDWQWMPTRQDGEKTDQGFLIHPHNVMQEWKGKKYFFAQCPKCLSYNAMLCPDCKTLINQLKRPNGGYYFECPNCKKEHPRYIDTLEGGMRRMRYLLGYQITVNNENRKYIMFIDEDGSFEISDDYNYK